MGSGTRACYHTYPARKYGERDKSMSPHTLLGRMGSGTRACHHTYPARKDGERDNSMSPHVPY